MQLAGKIEAAQKARRSDIVLFLAPRLSRLPIPMQRFDDPFLPFGRAVIEATQDLLCGCMFDLSAYLALGAAGIIALERTIPFVDSSLLRILHGPFVGPGYVEGVFEGSFDLDAVTLASVHDLQAYSQRPERGAFVMQSGPLTADRPYATYWSDEGVFTLPAPSGHTLSLRLAGEDVLYAGRQDNFTSVIRSSIEQMRNE